MISTVGSEIAAWLREHEGEMRRLLEELVNIDSGSSYKAGVDRVGAVLRAHLEGAGIATQVFPQSAHGDCLLAKVPASRHRSAMAGSGSVLSGGDGANDDTGYVLLLGHMDTVFPEGTARARPYRVEGDYAYGPGVADMKAGLVMNTFIAQAFAEIGGNSGPIRVLYTGDEEIASPASRVVTTEVARHACAVFNAEPGRWSGNVVTGRKGALFIDFEVDGVAAHAGVDHEKGASAIEAAARKIVALHALTDRASGITTNVGTIRGGTTVNTVAPHAAGQLDVRFPAEVDREALRAKIFDIIEGKTLACTCGRVTHEGSFLPFAQTEQGNRLLRDYQRVAVDLGFAVEGEYTGGSADSGLTASVGAPTLCATGPVGAFLHTDREVCRLDTLVPRAQAVALTLLGQYGTRVQAAPHEALG
jgi:glutamate carboxypeptidase